MDNSPLIATLAALPHFKLLQRPWLERIAACAQLRHYAAGELIFSEGEHCRGFFAIHLGSVKLYRSTPDGREQVVHHLNAGHTFAEAALFNLGRYPANAAALETPTQLVEIGGEAFLQLFHTEKSLGLAVIGSLCMRMLSLVERVEELSLVNAGSRLARYLLRQPGNGSAGRITITLPIAKKELAAHLSMTPETLSRLFRRWQEAGWIEVDRANVVVLSAEKLQAQADGEDPG